jgi:hypothetical protein
MTCLHFHRDGTPITCAAFSVRIPDVIWLKGDPHTSPVDGDHGIRYEKGEPKGVDRRE